ncbi:AAA family ATPase [Brevibacillus porteri]|uniref:AAA family ATPase n=1 Tax=Brevibacillus porteri TaxID=2126350 RepID=UPI003D1D0F02
MGHPHKIALTGRMRSGKDSVATHLAQQYGFVRFAFGDGIRKVCRELFPEQFADDRKPRALLQGVGQAMRTFDLDVWVNDCFRRIAEKERMDNAYYEMPWNAHTRQPFRPVITDLRQPSEYARLRTEGFVIIRVTCSDYARVARIEAAGDVFNPEDLIHETERYADGFAVDYEIENSGTLAELHAKVDVVMAEIMANGSDV